MEWQLITQIGGVAGSIITLVTLTTLIFKPIRKAVIEWITKTSDRDSINEKLDHLSNLVQTTIAQNDELQAEMDKQSKALQASLRNSILNLYNKCIPRQYITVLEFENLSMLYKNYKELGGNSFVEDCVEQLKKLERKND